MASLYGDDLIAFLQQSLAVSLSALDEEQKEEYEIHCQAMSALAHDNVHLLVANVAMLMINNINIEDKIDLLIKTNEYMRMRLAQIASGDYKACGHTPENVASDALLNSHQHIYDTSISGDARCCICGKPSNNPENIPERE